MEKSLKVMEKTEERKTKGRDLGEKFNLQRACRGVSEEVFGHLLEMLRQTTGRPRPQVKLIAARELLDRAYGKPKETIDSGVTIVWDIKPVKMVESNPAPAVELPEPPKELTDNQGDI